MIRHQSQNLSASAQTFQSNVNLRMWFYINRKAFLKFVCICKLQLVSKTIQYSAMSESGTVGNLMSFRTFPNVEAIDHASVTQIRGTQSKSCIDCSQADTQLPNPPETLLSLCSAPTEPLEINREMYLVDCCSEFIHALVSNPITSAKNLSILKRLIARG